MEWWSWAAAVIAAGVSLIAMGVSVWQALTARGAAASAREQASYAKESAAAAHRQAEAADRSAHIAEREAHRPLRPALVKLIDDVGGVKDIADRLFGHRPDTPAEEEVAAARQDLERLGGDIRNTQVLIDQEIDEMCRQLAALCSPAPGWIDQINNPVTRQFIARNRDPWLRNVDRLANAVIPVLKSRLEQLEADIRIGR